MADDLLDFLVRNKRAVDAADAAAACHVEHVAAAEELLRPLLAEDGAAVDLRGDLEGHAGREVGLDRAGDDVAEGRCVAMIRWMPAARAIWARRWMAPSISLPATIIRSAISSMMTTI